MESLAMTEKRFKDHLILFLAQGAYSGRSPFAPGTAGTLVAVPLYLLLNALPSVWYLLACILTTGIAIWASQEAEKLLGKTDDGSIVIDEIAGFLVAMAFVPAAWPFITAGFLLFRASDVMKPFPLRRLQELHGGPGIVLDDIGAGVYTNVVLQGAVLFVGRV
jgi:phosphatidylglycerophosphatase A